MLVLPGLCGSAAGSGHTVEAMLAAGLRPAVFHARGCGHALTSPSFNLFGNTDDLREAVAHLKAARPAADAICLYSISAGTGLMVRYLGEEGAAGNAPIAAAVANCPGYDIGVCLTRVAHLYDGAYYMDVHKIIGCRGATVPCSRRRRPRRASGCVPRATCTRSWSRARPLL